MRVLIVDDHELVRRGIRSLLSTEPMWEICGEAVDGRDAVTKAKELRPDVIVMDISMPNLNGLDATREIRLVLPQTEVLIVSQHENREIVRQAILAGAKGYVVKSSISRDLLQALAKVSLHQSSVDAGEAEGGKPNIDAQEILQRSVALELALRDSEQRYRALVTAISEIVWRTDASGRLLYISSQWTELSGQSEAEALGWGWTKVVHAEDRERLTYAWEHAIRTLEEYGEEWRMVTRSGEPRHLATRAIPIRGDDGAVREWVGVVFDIHERRLAEDSLRATTAQCQQVTDLMAVAVTRCSRDLRYLWVNPRYASWIGRPVEAIVGERIRDVLGENEFEMLRPYFEGVLAGKEVKYEREIHYPGAGPRWVSAVYTPTLDAGKNTDGWVGSLVDVTERRQGEWARLQQAYLLDSSFNAILVCDAGSRITYWNRGAEELYGWPRDEAMGQVSHILLKTEFPESRDAIINHLLRGKAWEGELTHTCRSGARVRVRSRSVLLSLSGHPESVMEIDTEFRNLGA